MAFSNTISNKPLQIVSDVVPFVQHFCIAISAADPGLSADTDGLAEAQSGSAPTVEGRKKNFFCFFSELLSVCTVSYKTNTSEAHYFMCCI